MNLPLELVDKILQYDGRIKYRKGEFVNVIHPRDLNFYNCILNPLLKKKQNINTIGICSINRISNELSTSIPDNPGFNFGPTWNFYTLNKFLREGTNNKFYFEIEFDSLPGVGLCYDYYWGYNNFQIVYFDTRDGWTQHTRIIAHDFIVV
jgi:hypothetical protein